MNAIEAEGATIEEAIANALKQLQVERERVEVEVLSQATKGFLGIGGKKARVRAALRAPFSARAVEAEPEPPRPRPRNVTAETPRRPAEAPSRAAEAPQRAAEVLSRAAEAPQRAAEGDQPYRPRERTRADDPGRAAGPRAAAPVEEPTPPSPELGEKACAVLQELLRFMGTPGTPTLGVKDGEMTVTVAGAPEGFLIGHRGQTLDAVEYLLNRIVTRSEEHEGHITVDTDGYRERRWKSLEDLALRLGERVKRRRKTITVSPLSPRDRRVIHLTLEGDPLVSTRSVGRGYFRQVCIVPEEGDRRERGREGGRLPVAES